jgi:flagellar hook-associated protein 3 FlgL
MAVRFTNDILSRQTLFDLQGITDKLSKTQQQLSSGKRITAPEDDPYGSGRAVSLRNELADVQQYRVNINDASAWAQQTDSSLGNVTDLLQRARELTVQAANGTQNQSSLNAIASEMTQIKASLLAEANSTYNGRYIFSGTATNVAPYPSNAYAGTTLPVQRLIAPGEVVKVNQDGPSAFGVQAAGPPATKNVFDVMDDVIGALNAGTMSTLQTTALTELDSSFTTALNARTTVGAISNRLDTQGSRMSAQELSVADLLSKTEDADMAKTLITYSQTQTAYQAALQAGAKIIQPTLMDFLR